MANEFYNRGATFNPDELADGDAIEAEFDAVARGFDTIGTNVDANKAGYPTQTFHVAPATEATHAARKEQLDAHINDQGAVHGATSSNIPGKLVIRDANGDIAVRNLVGNADTATNATDHINDQGGVHGATSVNTPDKLVKRDANGDIGARNFVGDCTGNANTATNATQHINSAGGVHGAASGNSPGNLMMRDSNGDVAARTFIGDLQGIASVSRSVSYTAPNGASATLVHGTMAGNDFFRVFIGGTADGGFAEIATADNGSEPIYVSQYSDGFDTLSHQAALLDEAGQTRFPVRIYCPSINVLGDQGGICSGNGDGANEYVANVRLFSWHGIGFYPSIEGAAVPKGQNSHWFDVRTGNGGMRGTLNQWSDIRLKEDIVAIPNALEKVCSIRGVTFTRKDSGTRETGVIAQEVLSVLPEAVRVDDQDSERMMSVAYGNLVGLLIEAIKDLKTEVDLLKAQPPA